jgi:hypothetical protein
MPRATELRRLIGRQRERWQHWQRLRSPLQQADAEVAVAVCAAGDDVAALSRTLVDYFWRTHERALDARGTLADYPGWPSIYGARNDAIEGVTRLLPLWAAQLASPLGVTDTRQRRDVAAALRRALVHGTDPAHPGYWGDIGDRSTLICEAADVALAAWLARATLWPALTGDDRARVLAWLQQAVGRATADNNWHLFVAFTDAVVAALDPSHRFTSGDRLARIASFARADGCFVDGPTGHVDFYNAWCFHYLLYWLGEIDAKLLDPALEGSLAAFCHWYQWLFTRAGSLPLFGRSLCYRFAASAPLLSCAVRHPEAVPAGVALGAFCSTWRYFVGEGGLRGGRPTQGVFGEDQRWLDPYSGPASSLWGTRSLVMLLYTGRHGGWADVVPALPPAALAACELRVHGLGATLHADPVAGECVVVFDGAQPDALPDPQLQTAKDRLRQALHAVAARPANNLLKAGERRFSSCLERYR